MAKVWAWIVQAARDVYSFLYTEIGTALSLLKYSTPSGMKYSVKRILAVALIGDVLFFGGIPRDWGQVVFAGIKLVVGAALLIWAAVTKT